MNAGDVDLGTMQVKLLAEISGYLRGMQQAQQAAQQTAQKVEEAGKKIEGIGSTLKEYAGRATAALASFAEFKFLKEAFEGFEQRQERLIKLNAVLEANGREVKKTADDYKAFAKSQAEVTTLSAGQTLNLLRVAESFELTGGAAKKAVSDAVALAAVTDGEAEAMIRLTAAMARGDTETAEHFARLVPQLRFVKDAGEFQRKYNALVEAGLKTQAELSKTAGTEVKRLGHEWEALKADLGESVASGLRPVVGLLSDLVKWFRELSPSTKTVITDLGQLTATFTALRAAGAHPGVAGLAAEFSVAAVKAAELSKAVEDGNLKIQKMAAGNIGLTEWQKANAHPAFSGVQDEYQKLQLIDLQVQGERDKLALLKQQMSDQYGAAGHVGAPAMLLGGFLTGDITRRKAAIKDTEAHLELLKQVFKTAATGIDPAGLEKPIKKVFDLGPTPEQKKAMTDAKDLLHQLSKEIYTFGQTANEKKLFDLAVGGVDAKTLAAIKAKADALKELEERQKKIDEIERRAEQIHESMRTPFEVQADRIRELGQILMAGKLTWEDYAAAVAKTRAETEKLMGTQESLAFGSSAFNKMVSDRQRSIELQSSGPPIQKADLPEQLLKQSRDFLQRIAEKRSLEVHPAGL